MAHLILKNTKITIPRKEYEELQEHVEDLEDTIAYRNAKKVKKRPVPYHVARKKTGLV
jgi:uncharacterized membrane protein YgaE (UPF0421/DUF939 family)